jgi:alanyl-tRNA synthetase
MTEKLYYLDAYTKEFVATVVDSYTDGDRAVVILDRTAFFPEEGGQSADTGYIGDAHVFDAREKNGVIYHYADKMLTAGCQYECKIDFSDRFEKMQCHTAEHIISGAIKRIHGLDNVGFHLGTNEVTMDVNGYLTRAQLDEIELIANRAVFDNVPVKTYFPKSDELSSLNYRSKLDLTENVRIVEVEGYDLCACCAPHVAYTGEIGLIKILDFEKHRGGLRINIAAGYRALHDYGDKYRNVLKISAMFSEPQATVANAAENFLSSYEELKAKLKATGLANARLEARLICPTDASLVCHYPDMNMDELREFANSAKSKVGGVLVALTGKDGDLKYVITSESVELSHLYKKINADLSGRGGGRDNMIQGSFSADLDTITRYFSEGKYK